MQRLSPSFTRSYAHTLRVRARVHARYMCARETRYHDAPQGRPAFIKIGLRATTTSIGGQLARKEFNTSL